MEGCGNKQFDHASTTLWSGYGKGVRAAEVVIANLVVQLWILAVVLLLLFVVVVVNVGFIVSSLKAGKLG